MKKFSLLAILLAVALLATPAVLSALPQNPPVEGPPPPPPPPADEKIPEPVKEPPPKPVATVAPNVYVDITGIGRVKAKKFKGEVLFFNSQAIALRSSADGRTIQTFTYTMALREAAIKLLEFSGYQPGDVVTVYYIPGKTVAVRIAGKPSRR